MDTGEMSLNRNWDVDERSVTVVQRASGVVNEMPTSRTKIEELGLALVQQITDHPSWME